MSKENKRTDSFGIDEISNALDSANENSLTGDQGGSPQTSTDEDTKAQDTFKPAPEKEKEDKKPPRRQVTLYAKKILPSAVPIPEKEEGTPYYHLFVDLAGHEFGGRVIVPAKGFAEIPTNIFIDIPNGGYDIQAWLSFPFSHQGLIIFNDSVRAGTKEELKIFVLNFSNKDIEIKDGSKLVHFAVVPIIDSVIKEIEEPKEDATVNA
jgi:dUTPase